MLEDLFLSNALSLFVFFEGFLESLTACGTCTGSSESHPLDFTLSEDSVMSSLSPAEGITNSNT